MSDTTFKDLLEGAGFDIVETKEFIYSLSWGVKFQYYERKNLFVIGYGNSPTDRDRLFEGVQSVLTEYEFISYKLNDTYIRLELSDFYLEDFESIINILLEYFSTIANILEKPMGSITKVEQVGPSFEGTVYQNIKERGATMSPMFGSMVCNKSGMKLERMLCEYYIPGGRIDGVELDEFNNVVSIYECGSGIHRGQFLDWEHWNKVLCRYMYSDAIHTSHLKRVVLLAGGYQTEMLEFAANINKVLNNSGIELILLATNKEENNIFIERVN
jgi:hypothetical protein